MADDRYSRAQSILIAERGGVLTRTSQHVIGIGAGNHEPRSEPDQFTLQHSVVANTSDSQHLFMRPTRSGHPLVKRRVAADGRPVQECRDRLSSHLSRSTGHRSHRPRRWHRNSLYPPRSRA